ncbi:MAG: hypothetical protein M3511_15650 [Deinococcota bacterium]|jgi:hypothetical protein|nr:hypothetical protein [Deinococcota bacterium]
MFHLTEPFMRLAHERIKDLRREAKAERLDRSTYPDGERQPRILRHWTNRF